MKQQLKTFGKNSFCPRIDTNFHSLLIHENSWTKYLLGNHLSDIYLITKNFVVPFNGRLLKHFFFAPCRKEKYNNTNSEPNH
jgi:hypothetical protein